MTVKQWKRAYTRYSDAATNAEARACMFFRLMEELDRDVPLCAKCQRRGRRCTCDE